MLPKFKTNIFSSGEIFSIWEKWISISGAGSRNENQFFLNRSRFLISGAHNFNFGSMLPKRKYFFQFRKKKFISGAGLTNSGAWIFLSIYLSIYRGACFILVELLKPIVEQMAKWVPKMNLIKQRVNLYTVEDFVKTSKYL